MGSFAASRAAGIKLSPDAVFPNAIIRARTVISNVTLVPTFLRMVGEAVIGAERTRQRAEATRVVVCRGERRPAL